MTTLVLLRHGATRLAEENRFAGWSDTPLSDRGWSEARQAGRAMKRASLFFDIAYTSRLLRAQETLQAVLEEMALTDIPVERSLQLNERHYGQLQEQSRPAMIARHGNAQVVAWRRDYRAAPPLLEDADTRWQEQLERFADIDPTQLPRGESLADAADRALPMWRDEIAPALRSGKRVLVVAHTSSIRGLARAIEGLSDDESAAFRIATAVPRVYRLDQDLSPISIEKIGADVRGGLRYWANRLKPRWLGWV